MADRWPSMTRARWILASLLATGSVVACGSQPEADYPADAGGQAAPQQQAYPQPPGYPQPGYGPPSQYAQPPAQPAPKGRLTPGQPPPPGATPGEVSSAKRDYSTLSAAEETLEEDELRLSQLLGNESLLQLSRDATCLRVCDSLASIRRAAESICELAGSEDDRCENANARLASNEERVAKAGCSCS